VMAWLVWVARNGVAAIWLLQRLVTGS
jgi:hypothetical protein